MSSLKKLRLTLAIIASKLRPKKRRVDFGAPSPHSQRWDERERSTGRRQQSYGPLTGGLNKKMLMVLAVVLAVSVVMDLLLPPLIATAVGLALLGAMLVYFFRKQKRLSY